MTGNRESIQFSTGFGISLLCRPAMTVSLMGLGFERARFSSADFHARVGLERVRRYVEVPGRRAFPDAPRGVVLAAVTRAEPAAPLAPHIGWLVAKRDAAKMRAD